MQSSDILCSSMQGHPEQAMHGKKKNYCIFYPYTFNLFFRLVGFFTYVAFSCFIESLFLFQWPINYFQKSCTFIFFHLLICMFLDWFLHPFIHLLQVPAGIMLLNRSNFNN